VSVVFLLTNADRHTQRIGGLTALERRLRELARDGVTRAVVAASPIELGRALPIEVEFVAPGTPAPQGVRVERADVIAGIELVDEQARRAAEWALIRGMNKSFEGPIDALINWRFSMRITRVLAARSLALTPNHVTIAAIVVGLCAAAAAARGAFALGGVLMQINSILDSCDGELARLRFQYSKLGQWLDNIADDIVDNAFPIAIGYALGGVWLPLALAAAGARIACAIGIYVSTYRRTRSGDVFAFRWWFERDKQTADEVFDPRSPLTWLRALGRRDTFVFIWMLACVGRLPHVVVGHALAIATVYSVLWIVQLVRQT